MKKRWSKLAIELATLTDYGIRELNERLKKYDMAVRIYSNEKKRKELVKNARDL